MYFLHCTKLLFVKAFFLIFLSVSCTQAAHEENNFFYVDNPEVVSGQELEIKSYSEKIVNNNINLYLVDQNKNKVETYRFKTLQNSLLISRLINKKISSSSAYSLLIESDTNRQVIALKIKPSIIIESVCGSDKCETLTGNVIEKVRNKIHVRPYKISATNFKYQVITPWNSYEFENNYNSAVSEDWIDNVVLDSVPSDVSSYIAVLNIIASNDQGEFAETSLPFKVVRPLEVKHFGKYELAEVYEPVPVTGCIPGTVGNNVQYTESESETRQNSVSINVSKSWSDSLSSSLSNTSTEGISVSETSGTVNSSSLSNSETQSEGYGNTYNSGESSNIQYNTSDGENWSWSLDNSSSNTQSSSSSQSTNTGVQGSTTVGVSGEGSLPFLAKASGKVEVSAGVSRNWGDSSTSGESSTDTSSRGYSTGGTSQNGRSFGSVQNESRSHSLTGSYVLSSSTSNVVSASSSLSSGRVWNMSESVSSGKVVTEGNSENIGETIVTSETSSTTFSYSGYIPRGRYGMFHRQTSRYVKLSEIIAYDLNGFPRHAGYIMMNTWAWAPDLSLGESCSEVLSSSLPQAECLIEPCGE